jgi:cobalamin synthase
VKPPGVPTALLFLVSNSRGENRLTPLAGLALGCVLAGILFSNNQVLGFIFFAIGIIVAVVDIYTRRKAS